MRFCRALGARSGRNLAGGTEITLYRERSGGAPARWRLLGARWRHVETPRVCAVPLPGSVGLWGCRPEWWRSGPPELQVAMSRPMSRQSPQNAPGIDDRPVKGRSYPQALFVRLRAVCCGWRVVKKTIGLRPSRLQGARADRRLAARTGRGQSATSGKPGEASSSSLASGK